jgi:hypothetical protein
MTASGGGTDQGVEAELSQLTEALLAGARRGATAELPGLLGRRQELLRSLRGRPVSGELCRRLLRQDGETRRLLETEARRLEGELLRLRDGGQALAAYILRLPSVLGLSDYVR